MYYSLIFKIFKKGFVKKKTQKNQLSHFPAKKSLSK